MSISTRVLKEIADGNTNLIGLTQKLSLSPRQIVKAIRSLKLRGFVAGWKNKDGITTGLKRGTYAITDAGRQWHALGKKIAGGQCSGRLWMRTCDLHECAWWHFRTYKVSALREILAGHAPRTSTAAYSHLHKYIVSLERAGILQRTTYRIPIPGRPGLAQWRLIIDLGPKAPVYRGTSNTIFDPNGGQVFLMRLGQLDHLRSDCNCRPIGHEFGEAK